MKSLFLCNLYAVIKITPFYLAVATSHGVFSTSKYKQSSSWINGSNSVKSFVSMDLYQYGGTLIRESWELKEWKSSDQELFIKKK